MRSNDFLVQKVCHDAGKLAVYVYGESVFILVAENKAAVEWVDQLQALLDSQHIVGLVGAYRHGVEFGQGGKSVCVIVAGVPIGVRVRIWQKRIYQDAKALGVRVQVTQLRHRVYDATAASAPSQAQNNMKRYRRFAALLQQFDLHLHLFAVLVGLAGKQKTPKAALLAAQRGAHNAIQNVAPRLCTSEPRF